MIYPVMRIELKLFKFDEVANRLKSPSFEESGLVIVDRRRDPRRASRQDIEFICFYKRYLYFTQNSVIRIRQWCLLDILFGGSLWMFSGLVSGADVFNI